MKYLKLYEDFKRIEDDFTHIFNLIMGEEVDFVKIPYQYYGNIPDFNIYVISGKRLDNNDYSFVQELYNNHKILNELYNLEYFNITLSNEYATIVLYDWMCKLTKQANYLAKITEREFKAPPNIRNRLHFHKGIRTTRYELSPGIEWSNGSSSNIALHDRIYNPD